MEEGNNCHFNSSLEGPVKTSPELMDDLCDADEACFNGGNCEPFISEELPNKTPTCECKPFYSGLYCEQSLVQEDVNNWVGLIVALVIFLIIVAVILFFTFGDLKMDDFFFVSVIKHFWNGKFPSKYPRSPSSGGIQTVTNPNATFEEDKNYQQVSPKRSRRSKGYAS